MNIVIEFAKYLYAWKILSYENYEHISLVPDTYNEYYVLGFGVIDSEFKDPITKKIDYFPCLEFMLTKDKIA